MKTRAATENDVIQLLALYRELSGNAEIGGDGAVKCVLDQPGTSIWCAEFDQNLCAMATPHILPNVTWAGRPYAVIENVVTARQNRGHGLGRCHGGGN